MPSPIPDYVKEVGKELGVSGMTSHVGVLALVGIVECDGGEFDKRLPLLRRHAKYSQKNPGRNLHGEFRDDVTTAGLPAQRHEPCVYQAAEIVSDGSQSFAFEPRRLDTSQRPVPAAVGDHEHLS